MTREMGVAGHDAAIDEGAREEHEAGRIAPRIADTGRVANPLALVRVQLRQPVDPSVRDAVGGARVEHPHVVARNEADRLARGIVGQAQDHDVGLVEKPAPLLRVLARGLRYLHQRHVLPRREPLPNLEPGRARLPVDEHVRHCLDPCPVHDVAGERTAIPRPCGGTRRAGCPLVRLPIRLHPEHEFFGAFARCRWTCPANARAGTRARCRNQSVHVAPQASPGAAPARRDDRARRTPRAGTLPARAGTPGRLPTLVVLQFHIAPNRRRCILTPHAATPAAAAADCSWDRSGTVIPSFQARVHPTPVHRFARPANERNPSAARRD